MIVEAEIGNTVAAADSLGKQAGGKAFAEFMLAPETQAVIKAFGVDKYGQPLFVPVAGKKDEDL